MSVPIRCRVYFESFLSLIGTLTGFIVCGFGIYSRDYHLVIWAWFAGFCALRVYLLHVSYLKHKMHDNFDAEQLSRAQIMALYLLVGSLVAFTYYLSFGMLYGDSLDLNYWPVCCMTMTASVFISLLIFNTGIYRSYLLTEHDEHHPIIRPTIIRTAPTTDYNNRMNQNVNYNSVIGRERTRTRYDHLAHHQSLLQQSTHPIDCHFPNQQSMPDFYERIIA